MADSDPSSRTSRILKMVSFPELRNVGKKAIRSLTISPPLTIPYTIHDECYSGRSHTRIRYAPDIAALDYPDLFPEEVTLLTQILCYTRPSTPPLNLPIGTTWTTQVYLEQLSPLIDKLPSGLKAKVPWLHSSLCPDHKKMSIMPLRSIFHAFRFELDNRLFTTWLPFAYDPDSKLSPGLKAALTKVVDVLGLWTDPEIFRMSFKREPEIEHRYQQRQCLACILSVIGSNPTTCLLLGAMILGNFPKPTKSIRVAWCEGWLAASFGVRETERWIRKMHEVGDALRAERQRWRNAERRAKIAETEMQAGGLDKIGDTSKEQQDDSARLATNIIVNPFVSPLDSHSSHTMTATTPLSPLSAYPPPKDSHFTKTCVLCPQQHSPVWPQVPYQTKPRPLDTTRTPSTPPTPYSSRFPSATTTTYPRMCAPKKAFEPRAAPAVAANRKANPELATLAISNSPNPRILPPLHPSSTDPCSLSGDQHTHENPKRPPPACTKPVPKTPLRPLAPILIPRVVPEGYLLYRYKSGKSGLWARRAEKRLSELQSRVSMERRV